MIPFPRRRVAIELDDGDFEMAPAPEPFSGSFERVPTVPDDEPIELSGSDLHVDMVVGEVANACDAFQRIFAEGIQGAPQKRAHKPAPPPPALPLSSPPEWPVPGVPAARNATKSAREAAPKITPRVRRRRRSLLPLATAVLALGIAAGLVADAARAGTFDGALDAAAARIERAVR